jgi:hypothetical protein
LRDRPRRFLLVSVGTIFRTDRGRERRGCKEKKMAPATSTARSAEGRGMVARRRIDLEPLWSRLLQPPSAGEGAACSAAHPRRRDPLLRRNTRAIERAARCGEGGGAPGGGAVEMSQPVWGGSRGQGRAEGGEPCCCRWTSTERAPPPRAGSKGAAPAHGPDPRPPPYSRAPPPR